MSTPHETNLEKGTRTAFAGLLFLLVLSLCALIYQGLQIRAAQMDALRAQFYASHRRPPLTDTSLIQSWMTYDYVGHLYGLPPDYLKTTLHILDGRYPAVTIGESAKAQHLDAPTMLGQVRQSISQYIALHTSTSTSATST